MFDHLVGDECVFFLRIHGVFIGRRWLSRFVWSRRGQRSPLTSRIIRVLSWELFPYESSWPSLWPLITPNDSLAPWLAAGLKETNRHFRFCWFLIIFFSCSSSNSHDARYIADGHCSIVSPALPLLILAAVRLLTGRRVVRDFDRRAAGLLPLPQLSQLFGQSCQILDDRKTKSNRVNKNYSDEGPRGPDLQPESAGRRMRATRPIKSKENLKLWESQYFELRLEIREMSDFWD